MKILKQFLTEAEAKGTYCLNIYTETLATAVKDHGDALGMLTAFRHAANSLAIEAGVIVSHVPHEDAERSVIGDAYFLQLIAESELRLRALSIGYERLRAAAIPALEDLESYFKGLDDRGEGVPVEGVRRLHTLREVLKKDLA